MAHCQTVSLLYVWVPVRWRAPPSFEILAALLPPGAHLQQRSRIRNSHTQFKDRNDSHPSLSLSSSGSIYLSSQAAMAGTVTAGPNKSALVWLAAWLCFVTSCSLFNSYCGYLNLDGRVSSSQCLRRKGFGGCLQGGFPGFLAHCWISRRTFLIQCPYSPSLLPVV